VKDLLTIPSYLFQQGVRLRGGLYDRGWLPVVNVDCPVISVGNLTVGGTGKTPFSIWLIERLKDKGFAPGFVSRGYGSSGKGVREVKDVRPDLFGDEPSQIRRKLPDLPIFIGPRRPEAIQDLLKKFPVDIVVADDAFQHRRLGRCLDIVLLDAMEPTQHYEFLPKGRAREGFEALERAQIAVITKANLANADQLHFLKEQIAKYDVTQLIVNYKCAGFKKQEERLTELDGSVFLVTGVARPASVRALVKAPVLQHKIFSDHHVYTPVEAKVLAEEFRKSGADYFVTTDKDGVKLQRSTDLRPILWQMELAIEVEGDINELDQQISRLVRPRA
jgi:tetraacyldisaccharide 4'-kinase